MGSPPDHLRSPLFPDDIPGEILQLIISHLDTQSLIKCTPINRRLLPYAQSMLFREVHLPNPHLASRFTAALVRKPFLAEYVRTLYLGIEPTPNGGWHSQWDAEQTIPYGQDSGAWGNLHDSSTLIAMLPGVRQLSIAQLDWFSLSPPHVIDFMQLTRGLTCLRVFDARFESISAFHGFIEHCTALREVTLARMDLQKAPEIWDDPEDTLIGSFADYYHVTPEDLENMGATLDVRLLSIEDCPLCILALMAIICGHLETLVCKMPDNSAHVVDAEHPERCVLQSLLPRMSDTLSSLTFETSAENMAELGESLSAYAINLQSLYIIRRDCTSVGWMADLLDALLLPTLSTLVFEVHTDESEEFLFSLQDMFRMRFTLSGSTYHRLRTMTILTDPVHWERRKEWVRLVLIGLWDQQAPDLSDALPAICAIYPRLPEPTSAHRLFDLSGEAGGLHSANDRRPLIHLDMFDEESGSPQMRAVTVLF